MKTQLTIVLMLCLSFSTKSSLSQSTLNWGTYIGGEFGASITDVAVSNGYVAVVGSTTSAENIAFGDNIHQSYLNNVPGEPLMLQDAYVSLYTLEGELQWCTYFGGEANERAQAVVFDGEHITLAGRTESSIDISTEGAFQESYAGGDTDAFVAKFNIEGELMWASYFGGSSADDFLDLELNNDNSYWICGGSNSDDFPVLNGNADVLQGDEDGILIKLDPNGQILQSSYLGGAGNDIASNLVILPNDQIAVTGTTSSEDIPVNGFQTSFGALRDAFIVIQDGMNNSFATYYGGSSLESQTIIDEQNGRLFISGQTISPEQIATENTFQSEYNGSEQGFLCELTPDVSELQWGTYIGGLESDNIYGLSLSTSTINLIGGTTSGGLASPNAYQNEIYEEDVLNDFILYQFDLDGNYIHSTYLGGEGQDIGTAVWAISDTQVIFAGNSISSGLSTNNAHQEQLYSGWMHGYLGLMDFGVGIDEETTTPSQLKIYPNPSAGHVRLQSKAFSEGELVTISIYNMHGQAVQQSTTAFNANMELDLKELSKGVYEVLLTNGVSSVRERLIVK